MPKILLGDYSSHSIFTIFDGCFDEAIESLQLVSELEVVKKGNIKCSFVCDCTEFEELLKIIKK